MISTHNAPSPNESSVATQGLQARTRPVAAGDVKSVMSKSINAGVRCPEAATLWHNSGEPPRDAPTLPRRPVVKPQSPLLLAALPSPAPTTLEPATPPSWWRHRLCRAADRMIAASSLVSNEPLLDMRDFAWTAVLRCDWRAIRDEARGDGWRDVMLWQRGQAVTALADHFPATAQVLDQIPGLHAACFAMVTPETHVPVRQGLTKGLITCHLGLAVPRDGDVRMRLHDRMVRWAEGETLLFDDTYDHAIWNEASGPRVVLQVQFVRPLRQPGAGLAALVRRLLP